MLCVNQRQPLNAWLPGVKPGQTATLLMADWALQRLTMKLCEWDGERPWLTCFVFDKNSN